MITKPTFLIDLAICSKNIAGMAQKARLHNLVFRPHFKTHQSLEVAALFKEQGITQITVSSVSMARFFAQQGWQDITIAFPVNILEIAAINALAHEIQLNLLVESLETLAFLNKHLSAKVDVFVKIDTGYHRTGLEADNIAEIRALLELMGTCSNLRFKGFLVHSGNTYAARDVAKVAQIHEDSLRKLAQLKHLFPHAFISIGDTPSCSIMNHFEGVDEIRPGNFVYYDAMQMQIGSCRLEQVAGIMACPVVAVHGGRNEVVIYGGAVHFSKEIIGTREGLSYFGMVVSKNADGCWDIIPDAYLVKLSQEHGTIVAPSAFVASSKPGDILYIIPAHSCLTANLMQRNTRFL